MAKPDNLRGDDQRPAVIRWSLAGVLFVAAASLSVALQSVLPHDGAPLIFIPALAATAMACGMVPGVAMFAASIVLMRYWLLPAMSVVSPEDSVLTALYAVSAATVIALTVRLERAARGNRRMVLAQENQLQELQHRVANSLQFIAGMLDVSRYRIKRLEDADEVLQQASLRIGMTGQLHRRLQDAGKPSADLAVLLRDVLGSVFAGRRVDLRIDTGGVVLPPKQATPLVLLVTEAATNAIKHAFTPERAGVFDVSLRPAGHRLELLIRDNGPGMPEHEVPARGLGMQIMRGLAAQLGGELQVSGHDGLCISVVFDAMV